MNAAESKMSQTTNPPATLKPQPKASRWAYVLIVLGVLALFQWSGISGSPMLMIGLGIALLTRPYP